MLIQEGLTGDTWGDSSLYMASPLRAFKDRWVFKTRGFWDADLRLHQAGRPSGTPFGGDAAWSDSHAGHEGLPHAIHANRVLVTSLVRMRTSHIKSLTHGWFSMLATIGYIALDVKSKLPGYSSTSMGSKFRNSGYKVLMSCGSRQLSGRLVMMVIIYMIVPGRPL